MYFHRTVRDRTATVWRRCSVAVVVDRWRCRPDVEGTGVSLLGRILLKKEPEKKNIYIWPKNLLSELFAN